MQPFLSAMVHYRGKQGLLTPRAAVVTATTDTLDPTGVARGDVPALSSAQHVHLWVFTPSDRGGFAQYDVPRGESADDEPARVGTIPPGTWCWPPRG